MYKLAMIGTVIVFIGVITLIALIWYAIVSGSPISTTCPTMH